MLFCNARGVANLICIGLKQRPRTNPTYPTRHAHINATRSHGPLMPSLSLSLPVSPAATRVHEPLVLSMPVSPAATCSHASSVRPLLVSPALTANSSSLSTAHAVATPHTGPDPTTGCSSSTQSEVEALPMPAASSSLVDAHRLTLHRPPHCSRALNPQCWPDLDPRLGLLDETRCSRWRCRTAIVPLH